MTELLTTNEVARCLYRSAENIRQLTKTGKLKCRRTATGQRILPLRTSKPLLRLARTGRGQASWLREMTDDETPSPWFTVAEAARYARVSASTLRRAIKRNRLVAFRIGSAIRLQRNDVVRWLRSTPTKVGHRE